MPDYPGREAFPAGHPWKGSEMTKTEALHAFRIYFADLKAEGARDGYKPDRAATWTFMVESWADNGAIAAETAAAWLKTGPR